MSKSPNSNDKPVGQGGISAMRNDARNPPADPTTSFDGKTILIVGATAGVGLDAAIKFARLGASRIVIGARNKERGATAVTQIKNASGYTSTTFDVFEVDFMSLQSVKSFATTIERSVDRIDAALINAGIASPKHQLSEDGWESTLATNVISTALCCRLLVGKLTSTAKVTGRPSVLQVTGSEGYLMAEEALLDTGSKSLLQHYNAPEAFDPKNLYVMSKLLNMFFAEGLAAELKAMPGAPTVVVCSPGMTRTSLGRDFSSLMKVGMAVLHHFVARTSEQGSRSLVSGVTLGPDASGHFWFNDQIDPRASPIRPEVWGANQRAAYKELDGIIRTYL